MALGHLYAGEHASARDEARACAEWIARGTPIACYTVFAYAAVAEVFLTLLGAEGGRDRQLLADARRAIRHLKTMSRVFPAAAPAAAYSEGALHAILGGATPKALRAVDRSRKMAAASSIRYQEARSEALLADLTAGTDDDAAAAHRRRAAEVASALRIDDAVALHPRRAS